jgi:hypothetical protein
LHKYDDVNLDFCELEDHDYYKFDPYKHMVLSRQDKANLEGLEEYSKMQLEVEV